MSRIASRKEVLVALILAAACFVLANEVGRRHFGRTDWTRTGQFTLEARTRAILEGLREPVSLTAILGVPASPETAEEVIAARLAEDVQELLRGFARASPQIRIEVLDPYRDPARARALMERVRIHLPNVVVVERGSERRVVGLNEMAELGRPPRPADPPPILSFRGEELLVNAILAVAAPRRAVAYFTRGHGERDRDDHGPAGLAGLEQLLRRSGFECRPLDTLAGNAIPDDASLVVVAGPERTFLPREARALADYLGKSGALFLLLDPRFDGPNPLPTGLEAMLAAVGIRLGRDIVRDPRGAFPFVSDDTFVVRDFGEHPVTGALSGLSLVVSRARVVDGGTPLLRSSPQARRAPSPGEPATGAPAVLALAAAVERRGRVVVVGDSDLAGNAQLENPANPDFLVRAAEWLGRAEGRLRLPRRRAEQVRLTMTQGELRTALWLVLVVLPGGTATAGITLLFARRRRA
jgi:hypothetical protein